MIYNKHDAIESLRPNGQYTWCGFNYSDLIWHDSDTPPTETEINNELTRLNNAEPMVVLREERDSRLLASDWTQSRDLSLSNDAAWKTYRQALRDLPASASPKLDSNGNLDLTSVTWPTQPS